MKRLLLTTVSALALISARPGLAADLPTRMPVKAAPAPVRVFSWTGCYLGGHVGWGWGRKTFADTLNGDLVDFFTGGVQSSLDVDTNGFLGGGQIGCDYQFATNWVVGVRGQFLLGQHFGQQYDPRQSLVLRPPRHTMPRPTGWRASRGGWAIRGITGFCTQRAARPGPTTSTTLGPISAPGPLPRPAAAGPSAVVSNGLSPTIGRPSSNTNSTISATGI